MKTKFLFILCFFTSFAFAHEYKVGSGNKYDFTMKSGAKAELNIYVSESSFSKLGIEYHFISKGLIQTQMWQQFIFKIVDKEPLAIEAGYVKTQELPSPETLTSDYLYVNKGVQVNDFMFSKKSEIEKFKLKNELIEVAAGDVVATHYRKKNGGQTVDFWISDEAGAIGLVKLVSDNPQNPNQQYTIELKSLIKNVKPTIDPKKAVPLSEKGKSVLASPVK
jgi:hypothetical protein